MPRKKTKKTTKRGIKSEFVRTQPVEMPAKEVIAKALEAGIVLTGETVYSARAEMRKKAKGAAKSPPKKTARRAARGSEAKKAAGAGAASLKDQLREILKEMGMAEARKVIAEVEAAFRK